ncbi:MAG TPA: ABC transporter ATP-binding protein [Acidimicrobiales bacterium]|nr:ABC transporter ATP-binding protein [Acidimicrobiales bacterium]
MLELRGLSCSYGAVRAVRDVSLTAAEGSITCIMGANGAGKSTTLKAIAGTVRATRGSVHYRGTDITRLAPSQRLALGIALSPEGRQVFPDFTVRENLLVGCHLLKRSEAMERIEEAYVRFPVLGERATQAAGNLSGGEQQMLAIARAAMTRPSLLLLDEPTLGLAPIIIKQVLDAVRAIGSTGTTVVIVEQNRAALRLADRAVVLANGRVILSGEAAEVAEDPRLASAYLGG